MKSSELDQFLLQHRTSIESSLYVIVSLVALLMMVTRSGGQEIRNSEEQESESIAMEQMYGQYPIQPNLDFHYEPQNRREPFLPLVFPENQEVSSSSSIEQSKTHKPTWKLLGIISGVQGYFASIQDSKGRRYIVTPGSVIPSEGLKVKRISETELEFDYLEEKKGTNNLKRSQNLIVSF